MKAQFIKLDTVVLKSVVDETGDVVTGASTDSAVEDASVIINANNISSIRRMNYNDTVQTMILMVGGERFGVHQLPEEILDLVENAKDHTYA